MGTTTLPAHVTAELEACKSDIEGVTKRRLDLQRQIDAAISEDSDAAAIPEETFDDPSVVREVTALEAEARRVRRTSSSPQAAMVASAAVRVRR